MKDTDLFGQILGHFLKRKRIEMGLTQEEFAEVAELDPGNYGKNEQGKKTPSAHSLYKIHVKHGISIDKLMDEVMKEYEPIKPNKLEE